MTTISTDDPIAAAAVAAIHAGDLPALTALLAEHRWLAAARLGDDDPGGTSRTLLHVATDWPGCFPGVAATIAALVDAGADVNARFRVAERLAAASPAEITHAFWGACHGGRATCAKYLLAHGAQRDWIPPWENLTPLDAARREGAGELVRWLRDQGARSVTELADAP